MIYVCVVIGLALLAMVVCALYLHHSSHKEKKVDRRDIYYKEFADICLKEFPAKTATQKIVNLRHCVFKYSRFSSDKKNEPIWQDRVGTAKWLTDHIRGVRSDAPPMECFYRSLSLVGILKTQGIAARKIVVIRNQDDFDDHVVVEVLNPDTGKWEVQGPMYDVKYKSIHDGHALGIKEMLTTNFKKFKPCIFDGECGWDKKTQEGFRFEFNQGYWNAAYSEDEKILYVSSKRFDETKKRHVHGKTISFCEWHPEWCDHIVHLE